MREDSKHFTVKNTKDDSNAGSDGQKVIKHVKANTITEVSPFY